MKVLSLLLWFNLRLTRFVWGAEEYFEISGKSTFSGFLADKTSCSHYYSCNIGICYRHQCISGHFDPVSLVCDSSGRVYCKNQPDQSSIHTTVPSTTKATTRPTKTKRKTTEKIHHPKAVCREGSVIASTENCARYFVCIKGRQRRRECTDNLHFHRTLLACVEPEMSDCQADEPKKKSRETFYQPRIDSRETFKKPKRDSRETFNQPKRDSRESFNQPKRDSREILNQPERESTETFNQPKSDSRETFNQPKRDSRETFNQPRRDSGETFNKPKRDSRETFNQQSCDQELETYQDRKDCRSYYQCVQGEYIRTTCRQGLFYSEKVGACVDPELSGCHIPSSLDSLTESVRTYSHIDTTFMKNNLFAEM
ncbi:uncharacterized protein LOC119647573 [Hermetia illucens]|uniref:uncharacterized protein LOC119647573 n=1 Tax=Hermetia illucens TaxID=343691 RepID=UPI0018CBF371|nr:uncharacterized protein LOC119647573 [Hermetia illucens]